VSNLNKKIYAKIEAWRNGASKASIRIFISTALKRTWAVEVRNVSLLWPALLICEGQGGQVRLVGVPAAASRSRPHGRAADHFRRLAT
jgi:hypothetical protein